MRKNSIMAVSLLLSLSIFSGFSTVKSEAAPTAKFTMFGTYHAGDCAGGISRAEAENRVNQMIGTVVMNGGFVSSVDILSCCGGTGYCYGISYRGVMPFLPQL